MAEQEHVDQRDTGGDTEDRSTDGAGQSRKADPKPDPRPEPDRRQQRRDDRNRQRVSDLEARNRELEDEAAERERKGGEYDKMLARAERNAEKHKADAEEYRSKYEGLVNKGRTDRLVERVAMETGIESHSRIRGLLNEAKADDDTLDIAPEVISDRDVKDLLRTMEKLDPGSFTQPKSRPQSPAPGAATRLLADGEDPDSNQYANRAAKAPKVGGSRIW